MAGLKRILCPTDFSDYSRHALEHAIALACRNGAGITLQYVFPAFAASGESVFLAPGALPLGPDQRRSLRDSLVTFAEPARTAGLDVHLVLDEGVPVERILARARAMGADLIVIGTHGAGGFEHLVLGSVAEKVLRTAPCPVLTVPPADRASLSADALGGTILCPVDFSECSTAAVDLAVSLAEAAGTPLIVLHALQAFASEAPLADRHFAAAEHLFHLEADARERMKALVSRAARGVAPEVVLVSGKAHIEILRLAAGRDVRLIVMGVQGRGALDRLLFGSTTNHVVRSAACPVLTVRPDAVPVPEASVLAGAAHAS